MTYSNKNPTAIICGFTKADVKKAKEFAEKRVLGSSSFYQKRGGGNLEKLKTDIRSGLLAEIAVSRYLRGRGLNCSLPCTKILSSKSKTFNADLVIDGRVNIHCKSQTQDSAFKYGVSCLFQKTDALTYGPSSNDFVCMITVDEIQNLAFIHGFFSAKKLVKNELFSLPKVPFLRGNKVALYLDEMLSLSNKDDRWGLFRKQTKNPSLNIRKFNKYFYEKSYAMLEVSGKFSKIDVEYIKNILNYGIWHLSEQNYVKNIETSVYLHQLIRPTKTNKIVDHINRDRLDNRKHNLRLVSPLQSSMNRYVEGNAGPYSSSYKGVSKRRDGSDRWTAYIVIDGINTYLGDFYSERDAAMCYNEKAKEYYGEFAYLNEVK